MTAFIQSIFGILFGSVTTEVCGLLLNEGADINAQLTGADATGWTALMFASSNGKSDLVKYLISKGADVHLKAKDGTTALSLAMKDKNDEIVKILKAKGANLSPGPGASAASSMDWRNALKPTSISHVWL